MTGLATETHEGLAVLIATPRQYKEFPQSFGECVDFLLSIGDEDFICWNGEYDCSAMLKFLSKSILKRVGKLRQWQWEVFLPSRAASETVRVHFILGKFLRIWVGERQSRQLTIYVLAQFYNMKLGTAGWKVCRRTKNRSRRAVEGSEI